MVFSLSLLSLSLLAATQTQAGVVPTPLERRGLQLRSVPIHALHAPTPDVVTANHLTLTKIRSKTSSSSAALKAMMMTGSVKEQSKTPKLQARSGIAPIDSIDSAFYILNITFGNQEFPVILDTGSSDTWMAAKGFNCTDYYGQPQEESVCGFGSLYNGTIKRIPDLNFKIGYGDGEHINGIVGTQDVTLAGITVPGQTVALATSAYWNGDGISSGLLGLAYPEITSVFKGTDPKADSASTKYIYDPIFTSMYKKGLSKSSFALSLVRDGYGVGSYIAFGGLPPPVGTVGDFVSTPIQVLQNYAGNKMTFYTITPDAFVVNGKSSNTTVQIFVDSGTSLTYLPAKLVEEIATLFTPPANESPYGGSYDVSCNATAPTVGVKISGTTFNLDPKDIIMQSTNEGGRCTIGLIGITGSVYILGDNFLHNVVAVFDVGAGQMRFATHKY